MGQKIGGVRRLTVDGQVLRVKGDWEVNLGRPNRSAVVGADGVHGYMEEPQVPFMAGGVSLTPAVDPEVLMGLTDSTVVLEVSDGAYVLRGAWWSGEANINVQQGEVAARFEGLDCEFVPA